jgi:hypothetical protein
MSISHRKFRALVLEYHDAGTAGQVDSTYLAKSSGDADDMWWCSRIPATGREVTTGMQPDHRVDAVFGFAAACPVAFDDALHCDGQSYSVRAVLERDYGRDEVQVYAERVVEQVLSNT